MSIFITQLIYIKEGQEAVFDQFEAIAISGISRYNGKLLLRLRPTADEIVELNIEKPYELHLVEFSTEEDFQNFLGDEERMRFLHLKEQSIRSAILIKGVKL